MIDSRLGHLIKLAVHYIHRLRASMMQNTIYEKKSGLDDITS